MEILKVSALSIAFLAVTYTTCKKSETAAGGAKQKKEILTSKTWQVDEVLSNNDCINYHYKRGGENNTNIAYNNIHATFTKDGKGTYTNEYGNTYKASWQFTSPDERNARFTVYLERGPVTYIWSLFEITETAFHCTTALSEGSNEILLSARYTPVK